MNFNYNREFMKFTQKWKAEAKLMRENGMSEAAIAELYDVSLAEFNNNRCFYRRLDDVSLDDVKSLDRLLTKQYGLQGIEDDCLEVIDQIANPNLLAGLRSLSSDDLSIYVLHFVKGYKQSEIARLRNQTKQSVSKKISKITDTLKGYF